MKPIDLTLTVSDETPMFPGSPKNRFIPWSTLKNDGYNLELLLLSSHTGTHMDAPFHFVDGGAKIHEISVERLVGSGMLVMLKKDRNESITKNDIESFESVNGQIPKGASIFFHTGWQKFLKEDNYFTENPGLSESVATYLVSREINMVGIDAPSIDAGADNQFPAHSILAEGNIIIVENLANLEEISKNPFQFAILPLKLRDATGSPVRAVAF